MTTAPLALEALLAGVQAGHAGPIGAATSFLGLVRAENLGRVVTYLDYEAYEPLALKSFARIAAECAEAWPGASIGVHHRVGRVDIGEASIAIVAVSAHRGIPIETLVPALVPLYFGRVAGLVIETWDMTTQQAESVVERQARAFELAKPRLVRHWQEAP